MRRIIICLCSGNVHPTEEARVSSPRLLQMEREPPGPGIATRSPKQKARVRTMPNSLQLLGLLTRLLRIRRFEKLPRSPEETPDSTEKQKGQGGPDRHVVDSLRGHASHPISESPECHKAKHGRKGDQPGFGAAAAARHHAPAQKGRSRSDEEGRDGAEGKLELESGVNRFHRPEERRHRPQTYGHRPLHDSPQLPVRAGWKIGRHAQQTFHRAHAASIKHLSRVQDPSRIKRAAKLAHDAHLGSAREFRKK